MKIVADDRIPYLPGVFESCGVEVVYLPGKDISSRHLADADALIVRTRTRCDRKLLENTSVKMVATATIGCDHISAGDLDELGIHWCNAPGCNASSVQQYVCSALINISADWQGKILGVVGVGHVGSLVAQLGRNLGMEVLLCDPPRSEKEGPDGFVDLETIAQRSDVVTLHVPFSVAGAYPTSGMIGRDFFRAVKAGGHFINSSRGEVVDEPALFEALTSGHLADAVIDVWNGEIGRAHV